MLKKNKVNVIQIIHFNANTTRNPFICMNIIINKWNHTI